MAGGAKAPSAIFLVLAGAQAESLGIESESENLLLVLTCISINGSQAQFHGKRVPWLTGINSQPKFLLAIWL
jgi:hypothetical protein